MILLRSIPFLIHEAFLNIRRQGLMSLTSISTVAIALCVLGGFGLLAWQCNVITTTLPRQWEFHAFISRTAAPAEAESLRQRVEAIPGVRSATLLSREEVWAEWQGKWTGLKSDFEGLDNPMPYKLEVQTATPEKTMAIAARVRALPGIEAVRDGGVVLPRLLTLNRWVRTGSLILAALLALGTMAIISNAIRITLFARRREIRVMQLVGATNSFVRLPFLLEGMIEGLVGGAIAWGLLYLAYRHMSGRVLGAVPFLTAGFRLPEEMPLYLGVVAAGGLLIGLVGSTVSIRRFLRP